MVKRFIHYLFLMCLLADFAGASGFHGRSASTFCPSQVDQFRDQALTLPTALFSQAIHHPAILFLLRKWDSENAQSFYGRSVLGALRAEYRSIKPTIHYGINNLPDTASLENPLFSDNEKLPGGQELRAVFSLFHQAGIPIPFHRLVVVGNPNESAHFVLGNRKLTKTTGIVPQIQHILDSEEQQNLIEVVKESGGYVEYIHPDAVLHHPGYQKDPFNFWLMVVLHEMAHTQRIRHSQMEEAGLDYNYDLDLTTQQIVHRFAAFLPNVTEKLLDHSGIEAILTINGPAFRRMRRFQRANLADGVNTAAVGDTTEQTGMEPGEDFRPAEPSDYLTVPETLKDLDDARQMEVDGRVIEEIFAGGAATRIRDLLNRMKEMKILSEREAKLLWNSRLRDFPKALNHYLNDVEDQLGSEMMHQVWTGLEGELKQYDPDLTWQQVLELEDWGHWGARAMISINAHVRRQARRLGINEYDALQNKRLVFYLPDDPEELEAMSRDFDDHELYGFGEILFVVNKPGPYIAAERKTGTFIQVPRDRKIMVGEQEVEIGDIVYGHGPATLSLRTPGAAYILHPGYGLRSLTDEQTKRPLSAQAYLRRIYPSDAWVLREHRINDLDLLRMGEDSLRELAFFYELHHDESRQANVLFRMVQNPRQVNIKVAATEEDGLGLIIDQRGTQAGGQSFVLLDSGKTLGVMPFETGATGGRTSDYVKTYRAGGGRPATGYLNKMASLKWGPPWLAALEQGLPYFFAELQIAGEAVRLGPGDGTVIKPQTATGHLPLMDKSLRPLAVVEGMLRDLKTTDVNQTITSIGAADDQDQDPLIRALARDFGFPVAGDPTEAEREETQRIQAARQTASQHPSPPSRQNPRRSHSLRGSS